ncbi:MAG TPA: hypothetical protein VMV14_11165 [Acidimicrobiales bacterium]|nr:hypothetical protein [Acidimicrobiales bacterium]
MQPLDAAVATTEAIAYLPAGFMLDTGTYEYGASLGYDGTDFYFGGRGGALGEVDGAVVAACFVFFNPDTVVAAWDRAAKVARPAETASAFAHCAAQWAEAHLPDGVDYGRLAVLEAKLIAGSSPAGAPLFAAWAAQPEPEPDRALALHRMHVLRELRGALHGAAVLAEGLAPVEALTIRTPFMAGIFGWSEPLPDPEPHKAAWERAEAATNRAMSRTMAVLDEAERDEFVALALAAATR